MLLLVCRKQYIGTLIRYKPHRERIEIQYTCSAVHRVMYTVRVSKSDWHARHGNHLYNNNIITRRLFHTYTKWYAARIRLGCPRISKHFKHTHIHAENQTSRFVCLLNIYYYYYYYK